MYGTWLQYILSGQTFSRPNHGFTTTYYAYRYEICMCVCLVFVLGSSRTPTIDLNIWFGEFLCDEKTPSQELEFHRPKKGRIWSLWKRLTCRGFDQRGFWIIRILEPWRMRSCFKDVGLEVGLLCQQHITVNLRIDLKWTLTLAIVCTFFILYIILYLKREREREIISLDVNSTWESYCDIADFLAVFFLQPMPVG